MAANQAGFTSMCIEIDYLDAKQYPLSTQPGLTLQEQRRSTR
jgi:hypothetical protein